jgi:hypothetical protein
VSNSLFAPRHHGPHSVNREEMTRIFTAFRLGHSIAYGDGKELKIWSMLSADALRKEAERLAPSVTTYICRDEMSAGKAEAGVRLYRSE